MATALWRRLRKARECYVELNQRRIIGIGGCTCELIAFSIKQHSDFVEATTSNRMEASSGSRCDLDSAAVTMTLSVVMAAMAAFWTAAAHTPWCLGRPAIVAEVVVAVAVGIRLGRCGPYLVRRRRGLRQPTLSWPRPSHQHRAAWPAITIGHDACHDDTRGIGVHRHNASSIHIPCNVGSFAGHRNSIVCKDVHMTPAALVTTGTSSAALTSIAISAASSASVMAS